MSRFCKKVDELAKQRAQRKEDSQYYMDSQQIEDYQSILHVQTRTLFNLMAAEIDQEPDPVEQEKIRSGIKASKRYLKDHHFDNMKALLLKEVESAYKSKHPRSTLRPRFHEDFIADWVRKSAEGETPVKWAFEVTTPMIYKCGLWEPRSHRFIPIASKYIPAATYSSYGGLLGLPLLEIETKVEGSTARDDTHSASDGNSTVATTNSSFGLVPHDWSKVETEASPEYTNFAGNSADSQNSSNLRSVMFEPVPKDAWTGSVTTDFKG